MVILIVLIGAAFAVWIVRFLFTYRGKNERANEQQEFGWFMPFVEAFAAGWRKQKSASGKRGKPSASSDNAKIDGSEQSETARPDIWHDHNAGAIGCLILAVLTALILFAYAGRKMIWW